VRVHVEVDPQQGRGFRGEVAIRLDIARATDTIALHAVDLRVSRARLQVGSEDRPGRVRPLPADEMIEVSFETPVPAGEATLQMAFAGELRSDLCGLYGVEVGDRR
jgi:aminopeptidase N